MVQAMLYKDIGKKANKTLSDDYDFNRKLKVKTTTANGVTFTTEGTMAANKSILAKLTAQSKCKVMGVGLDKVEVNTHGRITAETSVNNAMIDGLKVTFKAEDGSLKNAAGAKYKPAAKLGSEYRHGSNFVVSKDFDFASNNLSGSAVFAYENFQFGVQGAYSVDKTAVTDKNVALTYVASDMAASVVTKKNMGNLTTSFHHVLPSKNVIYSAALDTDLKAQSHLLTVGGRYNPDSESTFLGKVNSEGIVSLGLVQKIKNDVSLTVSANVDAKNIEGENHKFGMGLTLG